MMTVLLVLTLVLAAVSGFVVVMTRDPGKQVFALSANGLVLAILFFVLQAPDVAISELGVGTALVPLLFFVAMAAVNNNRKRR